MMRFATVASRRVWQSPIVFRPFSTSSHFVINAVGADRPGIVSEVSKHVVDAGGNVGESQAAKLGHYFSLMMLVKVPSNRTNALKESLNQLKGVSASIMETEPPAIGDLARPAIAYSGLVTLSGADQPGIVHRVTAVLAQNGLSIDRLTTEEEIAPHGGTTLFSLTAVANGLEPLSKGFDPDKVRKQLNELGEALNCDIEIEDVMDDNIEAGFFDG